jgi:hypothetical protein
VAKLLTAWCFNGIENFASNVFLFLVCFIILQVMTKEFGELAFEMECNLSNSMKKFHELCGFGFYKEIDKGILEKQRDEVMR